ncbi:MAG: ABC transporter ATP-binding protein [Candidatus Kariarchaeaceae archaeon]|jgi:ABC-type Fe3+/spermidine/putrescine transport system ATPase subunit
MASIELQNVTVVEKGKVLLDKVTFQVDDGEYLGLLGPSGEGPSAILKLIAGLLPITSGKILISGIDVTNVPPEDRKVGFIFEQFNLFPHLTVLGNLLYGPRMRRDDLEIKTNVAKEIITMVRLDNREDAIPRELSGGMQQRVGIARAVTAGANIMLLDQPYRALDAKIRGEMRFEIREIIKELGLTALHATHEIEEGMVTADRLAVFSKGKLEQIDTPENVYEKPNSVFVASFLAESNHYKAVAQNGIASFSGIKLEVDEKISGEVSLIIRHHVVEIFIDTEPLGSNVLTGKITNIRLLGEFIRFVVKINEELNIVSREMLALRWSKPQEFLNQQVYVRVRPSSIKLFKD